MAGGQRFQAQTTAWWASRILSQTSVGKQFDVAANAIPISISSETGDAIDDLRVTLTGETKLFGQCKRSLAISGNVQSEFGSVLEQFGRELIRESPKSGNTRRFVLYYEKNNESLKVLGRLLGRFRTSSSSTKLTDVAMNNIEQTVSSKVDLIIESLSRISDLSELRTRKAELLRNSYVTQLNLDADGSDFLGMIDALRLGVLKDPNAVSVALTFLHRLADDLIANRGTIDRLPLRQGLLAEGIELVDGVDYRNDFETLNRLTDASLEQAKRESKAGLVIGGNTAFIDRPVVATMRSMAEEGSFLVIGDAGVGKTGCLISLLRELRQHSQVWYWPADALAYGSVEELKQILGLRHPFSDLFSEAVSGGSVHLILDGLDALRDTKSQRAYRLLIGEAIAAGITVIASIRSFDLRYALELGDLFPPVSATNLFSDESFPRVNHCRIPELEISELSQVITQLPEMAGILLNSPMLLAIVRNLFSLELLCRLVAEGAVRDDFSSVATQAALFEMYWERRIHPQGNEVTGALTRIVTEMVGSRRLQVDIDLHLPAEVYTALFSTGIIRHPPATAGRLTESTKIEFNHHLTFDYVVEKLFILPRRETLVSDLAANDSWGLFLRPSLVHFYRRLWNHGRDEFWELLLGIENSDLTYLEKIPAYMVLADEVRSLEDLEPVLRGCALEGDDQSPWLQIVQGINLVASTRVFPLLFSNGTGGWWIEFAKSLVSLSDARLVFGGTWILSRALPYYEKFASATRSEFNDGCRAALTYYLDQPNTTVQNLAAAIRGIGRSLAAEPANSETVIRRLISEVELNRVGYMTAPLLADEIRNIWQSAPELAADVYAAIFGYTETDSSTKTSMSNSQILSLTSNKAQDYGMATYVLSNEFTGFLKERPFDALRAMLLIHNDSRRWAVDAEVFEFDWDGERCAIREKKWTSFDWSSWDYQPDEVKELIGKWMQFLEEMSDAEIDQTLWVSIRSELIANNESDKVWGALLTAGSRKPDFFARRLYPILLDPRAYERTNLYDPLKRCVTAFSPHLTPDQVSELQNTILRLESTDASADSLSWITRKRADFLIAIPEPLQTSETKTFLAKVDRDLLDHLQYRENHPIVTFGSVDVPPRWPEHEKLVKDAASIAHSSDRKLTDEEVGETLATIKELESALKGRADKLPSELAELLRNRIIQALVRIADSESNPKSKAGLTALKKFKEELSKPQSPPSVATVEAFDNHPSWSPDNYGSAAEGFIILASKSEKLSEKTKGVLRRLSDDPKPEVRLHLALHIWMFLDKWEAFVWETVERWSNELVGRKGTEGVLKWTFYNSWFRWLYLRNSERARRYLLQLLANAQKVPSQEIRKMCGTWLGAMYVYDNANWALAEIERTNLDFENNLDESVGALITALDVIFVEESKEAITPDVESRALWVVTNFLGLANSKLKVYFEAPPDPKEDEVSEPPEWLRSTFRMLESVARRVEKSSEILTESSVSSVTEWWQTIEPIVAELLKTPRPQFIFHVVKAIKKTVGLDLPKALHWLNLATKASGPYGLTNESMAADETIEILEKVLAEHKVELASGTVVRKDFIAILDAYLMAGWPRAVDLAIRVESIFR